MFPKHWEQHQLRAETQHCHIWVFLGKATINRQYNSIWEAWLPTVAEILWMRAESLQPGAVQKVVLGGMHFPHSHVLQLQLGPLCTNSVGSYSYGLYHRELFLLRDFPFLTLCHDVKQSLQVLSPAATHSFQRGLHCPPSGSWMLLWGLKGRVGRAAGMPLPPKDQSRQYNSTSLCPRRLTAIVTSSFFSLTVS